MADPFFDALEASLATTLPDAFSREALAPLGEHHRLLVKWAKKMNLTSVTDDAESARLHFADSLLFTALMPEAEGPVLDVGSGAGFPGLVLAAVRPKTQFVLLEPTRKRASFLRVVRAELSLDNVEVLEGRLEDTVEQSNLGFVPAGLVSRATLPPPLLVDRARTHLPDGGFLVASGGAQYPEVGDLVRPGLEHEVRRSFELGPGVARHLDRFVRTAHD